MDNSMWSSKMDGRQHIGSHAPSHVEIHVQVQGTGNKSLMCRNFLQKKMEMEKN